MYSSCLLFCPCFKAILYAPCLQDLPAPVCRRCQHDQLANCELWVSLHPEQHIVQMEFYPVHANKVRVPGSEGPNAAYKRFKVVVRKYLEVLNFPNQVLLDTADCPEFFSL